jgi:hypothetical protein
MCANDLLNLLWQERIRLTIEQEKDDVSHVVGYVYMFITDWRSIAISVTTEGA